MVDDEGPAPGAEGAEAGDRLLQEQLARIAALRAAVLAGPVPDDEAAFDYGRFFGAPAQDGEPRG